MPPGETSSPQPLLTPEAAASIARADLAAIISKVKAGRSLSAGERAAIMSYQSNGQLPQNVPPRISSKAELAKACGLTRAQLDRELGKEGNPGREPNGSFLTAEWLAWCERRNIGAYGRRARTKDPSEDREDLDLKRLRLEVELKRLELDRQRGDVVDRAERENDLLGLARILSTTLRNLPQRIAATLRDPRAESESAIVCNEALARLAGEVRRLARQDGLAVPEDLK